jgi:hypothetical protein
VDERWSDFFLFAIGAGDEKLCIAKRKTCLGIFLGSLAADNKKS